jgi:Putative transposase DNA-binding domain
MPSTPSQSDPSASSTVAIKSKRSRVGKTSTTPTRIYSYRVLPPRTEAARVESQFRLAAQYRNALVEVDRWLLDQFRLAQLDHPTIGPALRMLEDAQAAVDAAYDALRLAKSGVADPDLSEPIAHLESAKELREVASDDLREAKRPTKLLGASRKAAHALAAARRDAADGEKVARLEEAAIAAASAASGVTAEDVALCAAYDRSKVAAHDRHLRARADYIELGLRTGTYERVENAIVQAKKLTKGPLRFEGYDGSGSIGTQLIGGLTVADLHACDDTRVRLQPLPDDYGQLPRNRRRHAARVLAWLRVGSNPDRTPIFAEFPVTLHRPLPKDAVVKWAYVVRHRVGRYLEWRLQLTIESATFCTPSQPVGEGACAVNLGWRRILDDEQSLIGLRGGYVVDELGTEREILVPEKLWRGVVWIDKLGSTRDHELDAVRDALAAYLHDVGGRAPAWLVEATQGLRQWRSPRKMQGLVDRWRREGERPPEDGVIVGRLEAWARHDRHLHRWQETQRDRIYAHRKETWRVIAAELANRYATIVVEETKYPEIDGWEQPAPEDGDPSDGREQRRMSRLSAPGELRAAIVFAASKRGARTIVGKTRRITQDCAWCGHEDEFDAAASITHRCGGCGRSWDQDANACRNLLKREGFSSGEVPPTGDRIPAARKIASSRGSSGSAVRAALDETR